MSENERTPEGQALHDALVACNFAGYATSTPADCINDLARLVVHLGAQLDRAKEAVNSHADLQRQRDELREALLLAAPEFCGSKCPSVKYDDKPWKHCAECEQIQAALKSTEQA